MTWSTHFEPPERPQQVQQALNRFRKFLNSQVIGAMMLLICALVAVIWANSPWAHAYFDLWETELSVALGEITFSLTLHEWVNETLMMVFFLMIGLEVKEQILVGELSSLRGALLPVGAALGGMIVPALVFVVINGTLSPDGAGIGGWGIPMATDIAFALGVMALLGQRVPLSLKIFLAALAIADDIGGILVITLFYSGEIAVGGLLLALVFWLVIFALSRLCVYNAFLYFLLSIGVWGGFMISGVHATIAGVLVAMAIPAHALTDPSGRLAGLLRRLDVSRLGGRDLLRDEEQLQVIEDLSDMLHDIEPPLTQLAHSLQPWVTFLVLPLFALANAGVTISGDVGEAVTNPVALGVMGGLMIGKPVGIAVFAWLMVRFGLARLPDGVTWAQIHAVAMLGGIGFTVALFITELAYTQQHALADSAKLGILIASMAAGLIGGAMLWRTTVDRDVADPPPISNSGGQSVRHGA